MMKDDCAVTIAIARADMRKVIEEAFKPGHRKDDEMTIFKKGANLIRQGDRKKVAGFTKRPGHIGNPLFPYVVLFEDGEVAAYTEEGQSNKFVPDDGENIVVDVYYDSVIDVLRDICDNGDCPPPKIKATLVYCDGNCNQCWNEVWEKLGVDHETEN